MYLIEYLGKCLEKSITFTKGPKEEKKLNIQDSGEKFRKKKMIAKRKSE